MNRYVHFPLNSVNARSRLGRCLAPIDLWGDFGREMDAESSELIGGMRSLTMTRKSRESSVRIETSACNELSVKIDNGKGVYMGENFHHDLDTLPDAYGIVTAIQILSTRFEDEMADAEAIINNTMKVAHSR